MEIIVSEKIMGLVKPIVILAGSILLMIVSVPLNASKAPDLLLYAVITVSGVCFIIGSILLFYRGSSLFFEGLKNLWARK